MGSVKDLQIITKPTIVEPGIGKFIFSDRYSVFDWGEMPDLIPNKGKAIAVLGAYFFEKLEQACLNGQCTANHYIGLVEDNTVKRLDELNAPVDTMEVKILRVIRSVIKNNQYDYSIYQKAENNFLIPLEIIYRNALPAGSSVFKRLKSGETKFEDLGLTQMPVQNQKLYPPIIEVSTKLEVTDRYLKWDEAQKMTGLTTEEIEGLKVLIDKVNKFITNEFGKVGLTNEDGKIETGFDEKRRIILVDVVGTLDECRFTFSAEGGSASGGDDIPVSKEIARIYYRNTKWYEAVEEAKQKDRQNWKKICKLQPEPLPPELKLLISHVYCACTNEITGREWFENIPPLKEILKDIVERMRVTKPVSPACGRQVKRKS